MTINVNIEYDASPGEQLLLNVPVELDKGVMRTAVFRMQSADHRHWRTTVSDIDRRNNPHIYYYFTVESGGNEVRSEWQKVMHCLDMTLLRVGTVEVYARWYDQPADSRLYSSAYAECLMPHGKLTSSRTAYSRTLRLVVRAPQLHGADRLYLVSCDDARPDWQDRRMTEFAEHRIGEWQSDVNVATATAAREEDGMPSMRNISCRFAVQHSDGTVEWELDESRRVTLPSLNSCEAVVLDLGEATFRSPALRLAGRMIDLSRLRPNGGRGYGDLGSLMCAVDKAKADGLNVLHVRPLFDTISLHTPADADPYTYVSAWALHPVYADIDSLPGLDDASGASEICSIRSRLDTAPEPGYALAVSVRLECLRKAFGLVGDRVMRTTPFKRFFQRNQHWLVPYAQYCYLREAYGTNEFAQWPNHREWTEAERGQLANPRTKAYKKLAFYYYIQYALYMQLERVHTHAVQRGVVLATDMADHMNMHGCDAWKGIVSATNAANGVVEMGCVPHFFDAFAMGIHPSVGDMRLRLICKLSADSLAGTTGAMDFCFATCSYVE